MKSVVTAALSIAVPLALFMAALYLGQDRLLYFPARAPLEAWAADGLRPWPAADDPRGLLREPDSAALGTAVVFHGNAGHAGHRAYYADALAAHGWRVVLAEYPGYGPRAGRPGEEALVADAADTIALARRRHGAPVLVVGESLGAAVAAGAAARTSEHVAGLLLITPWARLEGVAAHHYPWLPVRWMLRDRYDSAAALVRFERPVVVVVAEADDIVPARFGTALHDALPGPRRLTVIAEGGHNDWPGRVDGAWWREALAAATSAASAPAAAGR
jgi:hypothetical protein